MRLTLLILLFATTASAAAGKPKNVILVVGDGMGPAHFTATRLARGADKSEISRMPVVGFATTHCADRTVTDSAAAATALATGFKTNYEMVSLTPAGVPLGTVLERAEAAGKATGMVTTAEFFDATVAAFASHATHRHRFGQIVPQMLRSGIDVIAGAGLTAFGRNEVPPFEAAFAGTGFTVIRTRDELDTAKGAKQIVVYEKQERDRDHPDFRLPVLARWAIDRLKSDPEGFFLLIEHEGTDSGSHQNNGPEVTANLRSFDEAVGVALEFARQRSDTLVVVTGDHDTGGLRITETPTARRWRMEWSTSEHTGTAVPVFAFGPGSGAFAGFYDNTDIGRQLMLAVAP